LVIQMQTQEMISIKASNQTEIRRFAIPVKSSFEALESSVRSMFSVPVNTQMIIKYTDDEGDLCTITTQPELDFATSMNPSLLRLHLFLVEAPAAPACHPFKEHMEKRTAFLTEKQARIAAKLAETTDPEQKRRLTLKLERIQQKLAFFESRKQWSHASNEEKPWMKRCGSWGPERQHFKEHMEKKRACLTEKQARISTKLAETTDPEQKRVLTLKLERIQQRISFFENRKHCHPHGGPRGSWGPERHQFFHEHMEKKHACLLEKQTRITAKLSQTIDADQKQRLTARLENIQQKLAFFEARKEWMGRPNHPPHGAPHHPFGHPHHPHGPPHPFGHPHHPPHPHAFFMNHPQFDGFLERRTHCLNEKRDAILLKLSDESINPERRSFLTEKLAKIEERQKKLEGRKQQFQRGDNQETPQPCRGRGGRRGYWADRKEDN